jgi:hypothetical protein
MKAVRLYVGITVLLGYLLAVVVAQDQQYPLFDPSLPTTPALIPDIIPEQELETLEDPTEPIWSLCGNPSQHLLIPYVSYYKLMLMVATRTA